MLHDIDIREPLFDFLDETYGKNRILEEKQIGRSRADIFMITDEALFGIEIKSDADTYARLESQVRDYDKFYDYNIVAVGSSHAEHVHEHIPKYWGIITIDEVDGRPDFYFFRKPEPNPKVKLKNKLRILWRPELAQLQAMNDMPKYKDKSKDFVIKNIVERTGYPEEKKGRLKPDVIQRQLCHLLMERDYTTIAEKILEFKKKENRQLPKRNRRKKASTRKVR